MMGKWKNVIIMMRKHYRAYAEANGYIMLEDYERSMAGNLILSENEFLSLSGKKVALEYGSTVLTQRYFTAVQEYDGGGDIYGPINVSEVLIPDTVTHIGDDTFEFYSDYEEEEKLLIIRYNGTATEGAPWGASKATLQKEI